MRGAEMASRINSTMNPNPSRATLSLRNRRQKSSHGDRPMTAAETSTPASSSGSVMVSVTWLIPVGVLPSGPAGPKSNSSPTSRTTWPNRVIRAYRLDGIGPGVEMLRSASRRRAGARCPRPANAPGSRPRRPAHRTRSSRPVAPALRSRAGAPAPPYGPCARTRSSGPGDRHDRPATVDHGQNFAEEGPVDHLDHVALVLRAPVVGRDVRALDVYVQGVEA